MIREMKNRHLALIVHEEREKRNLTQEHLAQLASVSSRTIQRLETTGAHSKETLMAVAEAIGIDSKDLLQQARDRATKAKNGNSKQPIPKSVRFEVFKRDSFKCQHCGASASDVLLGLEYIRPSTERDTSVSNLVTFCIRCLTEHSPDGLSETGEKRNLRKERKARKEQLDMMMAWKEAERDILLQSTEHLCAYWKHYTPGWDISSKGQRCIQRWLNTFSFEEITHAMDVAVKYLRTDDKGEITQESWERAFAKIGGICQVEKAAQHEPHLRKLYYIRGILKNRFDNINLWRAIELLKAAAELNVSITCLEEFTRTAQSWAIWQSTVEDFILQQKTESSAKSAAN
jgi:transcriptional regulator with XRE-family HTH domain